MIDFQSTHPFFSLERMGGLYQFSGLMQKVLNTYDNRIVFADKSNQKFPVKVIPLIKLSLVTQSL